ncbi:MAG: family 16 glycosylhydrolase [Dysgonomonas sp.]
MEYIKIYLSAFLLLLSVAGFAQSPANYELIWQDEFNTPRNPDGTLPLPDNKWYFETGGNGWGNNEAEYYVDRVYQNDTVAKIQDGKLIITAHKLATPYQGKSYVSARMNTYESWKYGYFEMKAKLPGGRGTWAAFWMMPKNFISWPLDGEIDILEYVGYRPKVVQSTIHTQAYNHTIQTDKSGTQTVETAETDFHTYGLEWTEDKIVGYADGVPYFTFENDKKGDKNTWPFNEPFYLKLNLAIGGDWGGAQGIDTSIFPSRYEIDYVRVYQKTTPTANFSADKRQGFAPSTIQFRSSSLKATEYSWDFGDGNTSTEENPSHAYSAAGTYTVSLTVKNAVGEDRLVKSDFVTLLPSVQLNGGGILQGANMENAQNWSVSYLNSNTNTRPEATWNYTTVRPSAGQGGALNIKGTAIEGSSAFCIYQKVQIDASHIYKFDGAFRDLSDSLNNFYVGAYISKDQPREGYDFTSGKKVADLTVSGTDGDLYSGLDGTFGLHTKTFDYVPEESGEYYFVLKVGAIDLKQKDVAFNVLIDELSLTATDSKPYTYFTAENFQGFAPLEVTFTNKTRFGQTYLWNFGDGNTLASTDPTVKHIYANTGTFDVSLKASNTQGDSTFVRNDMVIVGNFENRPVGEQLFGGSMENSAFWKVAKLGADYPTTLTWNYRDQLPSGGSGGCLRLQAVANNGESNVAIYQQAYLSKDTLYTFDCLYKDLGASNHLWAQAYITTEEPSDANDLAITEANTIGQLNTWISSSVVGYNGVFSKKAAKGSNISSTLNVCEFIPPATGYYNVIFKIGNTDWDGVDYPLDVALDNMSLLASKSVSGIENTNLSNINVFTQGGSINIQSQDVINKIYIYDAKGNTVFTADIKSTAFRSPVLSAGLYVVKTDHFVRKIIVE